MWPDLFSMSGAAQDELLKRLGRANADAPFGGGEYPPPRVAPDADLPQAQPPAQPAFDPNGQYRDAPPNEYGVGKPVPRSAPLPVRQDQPQPAGPQPLPPSGPGQFIDVNAGYGGMGRFVNSPEERAAALVEREYNRAFGAHMGASSPYDPMTRVREVQAANLAGDRAGMMRSILSQYAGQDFTAKQNELARTFQGQQGEAERNLRTMLADKDLANRLQMRGMDEKLQRDLAGGQQSMQKYVADQNAQVERERFNNPNGVIAQVYAQEYARALERGDPPEVANAKALQAAGGARQLMAQPAAGPQPPGAAGPGPAPQPAFVKDPNGQLVPVDPATGKPIGPPVGGTPVGASVPQAGPQAVPQGGQAVIGGNQKGRLAADGALGKYDPNTGKFAPKEDFSIEDGAKFLDNLAAQNPSKEEMDQIAADIKAGRYGPPDKVMRSINQASAQAGYQTDPNIDLATGRPKTGQRGEAGTPGDYIVPDENGKPLYTLRAGPKTAGGTLAGYAQGGGFSPYDQIVLPDGTVVPIRPADLNRGWGNMFNTGPSRQTYLNRSQYGTGIMRRNQGGPPR